MVVQVHATDTTVYSGIDKVSLTWERINVHTKPRKSRIPCLSQGDHTRRVDILRNVQGHVEAGTLLAILGASGSGKTTLLDTLTGRTNDDILSVSGSILVNGANVGKGIRNISAYVHQDDMFLPTLTVKEHLIFRAMLRMDRELSTEQRLRRADEVLRELGLVECANTRIGKPAGDKSISGGQMRRLSFASEILTNPPLMFCDEPTSGLDTFMAANIIQTLKSEANNGRTVLCTIHQPSSDIFAAFDHILLLAEGRVAFMGTSQDALTFFSNIGCQCPVNFNPADFYVFSLVVRPGKEKECKQKIEKICNTYESSDFFLQINRGAKTITSSVNSKIKESILNDSRYVSSWFVQMLTLLSRTAKVTFRDKLLLAIGILETFGLALFYGLVFRKDELNQTAVMDINGAIFMIIFGFSATSMYAVLNTFPAEVPIFVREYSIGLYRLDVYYLSKAIIELLPSYIVMPIVFSAIAYWMIGLYSSFDAFLVFTGVEILVTNISVAFGYMISAGCTDAGMAVGIAAPAVISLMMFGGFFLNSDSIPIYVVWLEYTSWFKYANEIMAVNQWYNIDSIACPASNGTETDSVCLFSDGQSVLRYLNYNKNNLMLDVVLLCVLLVFYRVLGFLALYIRAKLSRR